VFPYLITKLLDKNSPLLLLELAILLPQ